MEDQVPARVSDDVVEEEEEVGCSVEKEACVVEDEIFISEDEDCFVLEEVAKNRSPRAQKVSNLETTTSP